MKIQLLLIVFAMVLSSVTQGATTNYCDVNYVCSVSGTLLAPVDAWTVYDYESEPRCSERDAKVNLIRIVRREQMKAGLNYSDLVPENIGWFDTDWAKKHFPLKCRIEAPQYDCDTKYICSVSGTLLAPVDGWTVYNYESNPRCSEREAKINLIRIVRKAQMKAGLRYEDLMPDNVGWFDTDYAKHYFPSSCTTVD